MEEQDLGKAQSGESGVATESPRPAPPSGCLECGEDAERFGTCPQCRRRMCQVCLDDGHEGCGYQPVIGDGFHVELKRRMGQRAMGLHKADGGFVSQLAVVAARFAREQIAASTTPLCPVHQALEDRNQLEVEIGGLNCLACTLAERVELLDILAAAMPELQGWTDSVTVMRALVKRSHASADLEARLREAIAVTFARRIWAFYAHKDSISDAERGAFTDAIISRLKDSGVIQ